jgi:hypothetical protein
LHNPKKGKEAQTLFGEPESSKVVFVCFQKTRKKKQLLSE